MDYPKHMFRHPGPYGVGDQSYDVAGAADEAGEELLASQGWKISKEDAWVTLDQDGEPGGSVKQTDPEVPKLRTEYHHLAGKKPFPGWNAEVLREKIAALSKG